MVTARGLSASYFARPAPFCLRAYVPTEYLTRSNDYLLMRRNAAWPGHNNRSDLWLRISALAGEEPLSYRDPEPLSADENQEQWLDHLLQGVEFLLVVTVAVAQIPALGNIWQEVQKSSRLAKRYQSDAKVRQRDGAVPNRECSLSASKSSPQRLIFICRGNCTSSWSSSHPYSRSPAFSWALF